MNLFHQYVERFRHTWVHAVIAIDNIFVDARTTIHIVGLHGEHFLQGVGGAVGLQRPALHLPETLTTELCFTAQWLLRDQRV